MLFGAPVSSNKWFLDGESGIGTEILHSLVISWIFMSTIYATWDRYVSWYRSRRSQIHASNLEVSSPSPWSSRTSVINVATSSSSSVWSLSTMTCRHRRLQLRHLCRLGGGGRTFGGICASHCSSEVYGLLSRIPIIGVFRVFHEGQTGSCGNRNGCCFWYVFGLRKGLRRLNRNGRRYKGGRGSLRRIRQPNN